MRSLTKAARKLVATLGIAAIIWGALNRYAATVRDARQAVLHEDLHSLCTAVRSFREDRHKDPRDAEALVEAGYFQSLPDLPERRSVRWSLESCNSEK